MKRKSKIGFLVDHALDPRLRKRLKMLSNITEDITVYSDSQKGTWVATENWQETVKLKRYEQFGDDLNFDLIYVSGAKVFADKFITLMKLRNKAIVVSEVPDLPLRRKSDFANKFIGLVFGKIVSLLSDCVVLTSAGFSKFFVGHKNVMLLENVPNKVILNALSNNSRNKTATSKVQIIKIGFIGAIRYLPQLKMLLQFITSYRGKNDVELHVHGGPVDKLEKMIQENEKFSSMMQKRIFLHGAFNYEKEIVGIYQNVDLTYAVYDANQLNVRLALPNKLYESIASGKPIIVASNTFLAKTVAQHDIGWNVTSKIEDINRYIDEMSQIVDSFSDQRFDIDTEKFFDDLNRQEKELFIYLNNQLTNAADI